MNDNQEFEVVFDGRAITDDPRVTLQDPVRALCGGTSLAAVTIEARRYKGPSALKPYPNANQRLAEVTSSGWTRKSRR